METCSICLDALDGGVAALACGHRFHAACLASMAGAVGTAATTSRRGTLTACPNCRITSRVAPVTSAAHGVGDKVLALWGYKWYPGVVDEVIEGGRAYKIAWDDGIDGEVPAAHLRAAPLAVDVDVPPTRDASPAAVVTPRAAPPVEQGRKPVPKKRGRPRKSPVAVEEAEAAKQPSLEAEIKAAIAKKPKVAAESTAMILHTTKQVNDLGAVDIKTIADLALASVDKEKHLRAVSTNKRIREARPVFWNLKSAAAKRLDVDIGALPRAPYGFLCGRVSVTVIDTNPAPAVDVAP